MKKEPTSTETVNNESKNDSEKKRRKKSDDDFFEYLLDFVLLNHFSK